ncbi:MAG: hypothetical protein RR412_11735, partial [Burkholderiaceae bacterium]
PGTEKIWRGRKRNVSFELERVRQSDPSRSPAQQQAVMARRPIKSWVMNGFAQADPAQHS